MKAKSLLPRWLGIPVLVLLTSVGHAQNFTILKSFGILTNVSGFLPESPLVEGPDGSLFGTTSDGEGAVDGTIFKIQPDGSGFTLLKWFTNYAEGWSPRAGVTLSDGVLYGTTTYGGSSNAGTVFRLNTDGTGYQMLKDFLANGDGAYPSGHLTWSDGVLYGTTSGGGSSNAGTVFRLNTDGTGYAVLRSFGDFPGDGPSTGLTLSGTVLYGTTSGGSRAGTVFRLNTDGTGYIELKTFNGHDGWAPSILISSGNVLYGITTLGGISDPFFFPMVEGQCLS